MPIIITIPDLFRYSIIVIFSNNILFSIGLSSIIHIIILIVIITAIPDKPAQRLKKKTNPIPVTFKHLNTIGKKNGEKKDTFSIPIRSAHNPSQKKNISRSRFSPSNKSIDSIIKKTESYKFSNNQHKRSQRFSAPPSISKYDVINYSAVTPDTQEALRIADFNMNISTPKGISKGQLNSIEKIFYSFYKRTYTKYVHSFIKSRNNIIRKKPYLKSKQIKSKHIMSAKVTYDSAGNVISIKTIRWSEDDELQKLFQKTVEGIANIPNPPKDLIDTTSRNFVIHYQLHFNRPGNR